jgi:Penicillin V acylase and related amidases
MPARPFLGCTSLTYRDTAGRVYLGRTMELTADFPYQLLYLPAGRNFISRPVPGRELHYSSRLASLCVVMPYRIPSADSPLTVSDLKAVEGFNEAGLTFSLLAYPAIGEVPVPEGDTPLLAATDLGTWTLGQFRTVAEVKAALATQKVHPEAIALLGGTPAPFHYVLHDRTGASIVLEFHAGRFHVHDNPVGVLTNGPEFPWHLTNLNNYSFLSNEDRSKATFGSLAVHQPDAGIATAGLPSSNTSVGRFVRAVFYREFAEKVSDPDHAVQTLAHVMNNFDRPRGISISPPGDADHLEVPGLVSAPGTVHTEYTSWTNLTDLERGWFFLRTYHNLNYTRFDLTKLAGGKEPRILPLSALDGTAADATGGMVVFG